MQGGTNKECASRICISRGATLHINTYANFNLKKKCNLNFFNFSNKKIYLKKIN